MAMPRKLKMMNLFVDGNKYAGQATEITLPKLAMKTEEFRAGGMIGAVDVNLGAGKAGVRGQNGRLYDRVYSPICRWYFRHAVAFCRQLIRMMKPKR